MSVLCRSGGEDATCSAACALANLTDSHEENWERMAHVQKGFATLVAVAGSGSLEGRAHAVRALANLAVPHANKTLIAKTPRALQVLVEALEMDRGATQSNAAAAIGNRFCSKCAFPRQHRVRAVTTRRLVHGNKCCRVPIGDVCVLLAMVR